MPFLRATLCVILIPSLCVAQEHEAHPMTTERPSKTDSPYSLRTGQVQIETNLYGYIRNDDCTSGACVKTTQHDIGGGTNLRIGIAENMDLQIISNLYQHLKTQNTTTNTQTTQQGFGNTTLRLKINAFGNHPSDHVSLGILPYISLPTHQDGLANDDIEGGLGLPFNIALDHDWNVGGMTQLNLISDNANNYNLAYANSLIVSKPVTDTISLYGEFYTYRADQSGARWENTLDFGTVYMMSEQLSVDANIQFGVTDAADDLNVFIGTAYRF